MPTFATAPGRAPVMADLVAQRQRLEIWCGRCHRYELIAPERAVEMLGPTTTFPAAERRLVCSACGARGCEKWIKARGSIEDYYAALIAHGGQPMPDHRGSAGPKPADGEDAGPAATTPRHGRARRRRSPR